MTDLDSLLDCSSMTLDDHNSSFSKDSISTSELSSDLKSGGLDLLFITEWYPA